MHREKPGRAHTTLLAVLSLLIYRFVNPVILAGIPVSEQAQYTELVEFGIACEQPTVKLTKELFSD